MVKIEICGCDYGFISKYDSQKPERIALMNWSLAIPYRILKIDNNPFAQTTG